MFVLYVVDCDVDDDGADAGGRYRGGPGEVGNYAWAPSSVPPAAGSTGVQEAPVGIGSRIREGR